MGLPFTRHCGLRVGWEVSYQDRVTETGFTFHPPQNNESSKHSRWKRVFRMWKSGSRGWWSRSREDELHHCPEKASPTTAQRRQAPPPPREGEPHHRPEKMSSTTAPATAWRVSRPSLWEGEPRQGPGASLSWEEGAGFLMGGRGKLFSDHKAEHLRGESFSEKQALKILETLSWVSAEC